MNDDVIRDLEELLNNKLENLTLAFWDCVFNSNVTNIVGLTNDNCRTI